jgi:hypothetical protein
VLGKAVEHPCRAVANHHFADICETVKTADDRALPAGFLHIGYFAPKLLLIHPLGQFCLGFSTARPGRSLFVSAFLIPFRCVNAMKGTAA